MRFFSRHKKLSAAMLILAIAFAGIVVWLVVGMFGVPVEISKETTYITEPLRADGYPDYVAALNQRLSQGVTPENNAAVLLWKAAGPGEIKKELREKYFQMLGVPPQPEKGDYYVTSEAWIERHKSTSKDAVDLSSDENGDLLSKQFDLAMKRPWSKEEFPVWAEWLAANEKPLALVVEACKRPRRYDPLVLDSNDEQTLMAAPLPGAQQSRDFARALVMRAMLRAKQRKIDEAWDDLLICHRLGRLIGQGPTIVDGLVGITFDGMAQTGDKALLEHAKLTLARIAKMRDDLDKLPPMFKMADKLDIAERFIFLDGALAIARNGPGSLGEIANGDGKTSKGTTKASLLATDWNIVLRMGNSWYDRIVDAHHKPTRAKRRKAMDNINDDIQQMAKSVRDIKSFVWSMLKNPSEAAGERIGKILVSLLLPASGAAQDAEDRAAMQLELTKLAFALAQYRADHGSYPAKLADIVPKYAKETPKDIFNNDAELHYTLQGGGYLLYSFGVNGKDDVGKGYDDRKEGEQCDDLVVRMTAK